MTLLVDPPQGWAYGFPAPLQEDYKQQLLDAGYPERDIPMAMRHSRYMGTHEELKATAKSREEQVFNSRPLPKVWKIGQKVRYTRDSEWAWSKGDVGFIIELWDRDKGKPTHEYQVFYTAIGEKKYGRYWTTPDDVELIEDVED
jgi:hypothetical protein